jgi:transposase
MRGADISQPKLFITNTVADFVPKDHPLRSLRLLIDEALNTLDGLLDGIHADPGRASVAPERLMRASPLQVLYTIRSERQLVEQIHYNMLYRWFVGLEIDDPVWHHATFSKNRDRLLDNAVLPALFDAVLAIARKHELLSEDHFSVDGTWIDAWASRKGSGCAATRVTVRKAEERDCRGEKRSNATHVSRTDPESELMRKGKGMEARLRYGVHPVVEKRNPLVVALKTAPAARAVAGASGSLEFLSLMDSARILP